MHSPGVGSFEVFCSGICSARVRTTLAELDFLLCFRMREFDDEGFCGAPHNQGREMPRTMARILLIE